MRDLIILLVHAAATLMRVVRPGDLINTKIQEQNHESD
jgi:hypothetical protein